MSTLQQPPRRHLEARKCWQVDLQGGWQALLTLGTAPLTPITLGDSPVNTVESFRFLGTILSQDLKL